MMVTVEDAQRYVLEHCLPLATVEVAARAAVGLVLSRSVAAAEDVPPFANSAVDGYAVRACDVAAATTSAPVVLAVVDEVAAGASTSRVVGAGEAIRIMTGAPIPAGADAIVMVEDTERLDGGERVAIRRIVDVGDAVRPVGDDVREGTPLYPAGTLVSPSVAAVLAGANVGSVHVVRRPRVAVLSTGDELVDDGAPLAPGQIRESNRTMLVGLVNAAGCEAVDLGTVRDDEAALEDVLRRAAVAHDAIVTSGGVSMGDYDVVKAVLSRLATMRWMQIAIKPAKPFAFGLLGSGVPVFGLPGNPVSSFVSFELLARPGLRQMAGHPTPHRPTVWAVADGGLRRRADGKVHYMRVVARFADDGRVHVESVGAQGSHQLAATSLANALAVVPDGDGVEPGGAVRVVLLSLA